MTFESGNTEFSTDIFNSFVYMHGYIHLLYILLELMQSLTCFIISCADILKTLLRHEVPFCRSYLLWLQCPELGGIAIGGPALRCYRRCLRTTVLLCAL